ncbi:hypothetical protein [Microbacterium aurum]
MTIIVGCVALIALLIKLVWRGFTFWGDNAESFFPFWHMFGTALRAGRFLLFDADGWGAANVVGEAAYGVFNPITMLNALFISLSDRISVTGFIVMVEFLVLFGIGLYALARTYGASRAASLLVGVIAPFGGYTLFYEAGNWASGLMAITWVVHFWWSARAFAGGRVGPWLPVVFGTLAVTVGNPYSTVGVLVVLLAVGAELLFARDMRRFSGLVIVGAIVGTAVLLTYLPLMMSLSQIDRPVAGDAVENLNYLTPTLSDLLGMSAPSYLPRFRAWYSVHDLVPSTYLSWIVLPLLPWIRWAPAARATWLPRLSLSVATLVFLLLCLGPDRLWLFRWPVRFVEYFYVGALALFALLLTRGFAGDRHRRRWMFTGFALLTCLFLSWSSTPERSRLHVFFTVLTVALAVLAIVLWQRRGMRAAVWVAIIGTAIVAPIQGVQYGWTTQQVAPGVDRTPPSDLSTVRAAVPTDGGRILQVAELERVPAETVTEGRLVFGNIGAAAGMDILNRYSGINFAPFKYGMHMDYRGSIGESLPLKDLVAPVADEYPIPLLDALGVQTLIVQADRSDIADVSDFPGWDVAEQDSDRVVLTRTEPINLPAVFSPDGVGITDATVSGNDISFAADAPDGGRVLLDRLAWNGYTATADGASIPVETGPLGLIVLTLPAGQDLHVQLHYRVPGLAVALGGMAVGIVAIVLYQVVWVRRFRCMRSAAASSG